MTRMLLTTALMLLLFMPFSIQAAETKKDNKENVAVVEPVASENKVDGLELPADMDVSYDEGYVIVQAKCKGAVKWLVIGSAKIKYHVDNNDLIVSIPPSGGTINIYAVGLVDSKQTDFARTIISIQSPLPDPNVNPTPVPVPPKPVKVLPKDTKLLIIAILDLDKVTPEVAKVLNDSKMRQKVASDGHDLQIFDTKDPLTKQKNLLKAYEDNGSVPTLLFMTPKDGKVHNTISLPKTADEVLAVLSKLLGGS